MRRYTIAVDGKSFTLDVRGLSQDTFEVTIGNRKMAVQLAEGVDLPRSSITPDLAASLSSSPPGPPPPGPTQSGAAVAPLVVPLARPGVATAGAGIGAVTAPMPGVIAAIEAAPGARVKRGQPLFSLEAMKMLNAIRSPRDGVVAEVLVARGQTVAFGDPLLRFER
ncbi:MAG: acetyl-CoA carboxylase biotin carboxyl carrier protein subunit [Deltaproteobacteria bacterium]|nr:acetyl-CoA carboxylase biotin carboxyl carrier protein subunit [Deltaproteobacteria bacterium]